MKEYTAYIKEYNKDNILNPSIQGKEMSIDELIEFWALNNSDVESYQLFEITDDNSFICIAEKL